MKKMIAFTLAVMLLIGMLPLTIGVAAGLESKLLGEWNFDNESTGTATLYNNATEATGTYVDGISGKALKLSTKDSGEKYWLDIPYSTFGDNKDSFTISLWYKAEGYNASGENSEIFSLYNASAEKFLFYGILNDGSPNAFTMKWDGTYGYANVIGGHKQNTWTHLVFSVGVVDGRSKITAYVNGAAVDVDQGGEWANSLMTQFGINKFTIGGKNPYKGGATPNCLFYGSVDEVQLYAGVLSAAEAAELYNNTINPPAEEGTLLGEWNFNDQTTGTATLYNNATEATGTYVDGISGKALKLSTKGTDEKYWLDVPYSAFGNNKNDFTLSLWYKAEGYNTSGENSEIFSLYNSSAEKFLFYGILNDGNPNAFTMKWDGSYGYANVIGGHKQNAWTHLVFSVSNVNGQSKVTAYVNGVAVEVDQGGEWANSLMTQLGINKFTIGGKNPYKGGATPNCLFYGAVDEVKLYAGALSAATVAKMYDDLANHPAAPGSLLGEWNFNDGTTGTATLFDNATAVNGTYVEGVSGTGLQLSTVGGAEKLWLSIPYSTFGKNKDSFTLSMWYNAAGHNTSGENSELFTLYNSSAEKFLFYGAHYDGNSNGFTMKWDGTYGYANVIGSYKENEWVHIVFCVDNVEGKSKVTAYINGAAVEVDQGGEWANSLMSQMGMDTFTIGGKNPYKGGATPNCLFYGSVDEVKLYAGALSADQAKAIYDAEVPACKHPNDQLTWKHDDNQHWQECTCGHATDKAAHDGNAVCVCGYEKPCDHANAQWKHNDEQHWKECACGHSTDKENHNGNAVCVCGYEKPVEPETPEEPPKTGDGAMIMAASILAVLSATGVAVLLKKREA